MLTGLIIFLLILDVIVFTQIDRYILSAFLLVLEFVVLWKFFPEIQTFLQVEDVSSFLMYAIPVYISIGVATAAAKWLLFNLQVARIVKKYVSILNKEGAHVDDRAYSRYAQLLLTIDRNYGVRRLLKNGSGSSRTWVKEVHTKDEMNDILTPSATNYVDRIASWIAQWPVVVIALFVEDILFKFSTFVSEMFGALFSQFSKYLIKNATKDLDMAERS